jgi:GNAT superfamily N-acetyltransferase
MPDCCHPERSPALFLSRPATAGRARDAERDLLLATTASPKPKFQLELRESKKRPNAMNFLVRKATPEDIPHLRKLIESSVRGLQANDYTPAQIAGALQSVYGVDTQLIADGTYFAVQHVGVREAAREDDPAPPSPRVTSHESLVTAPIACESRYSAIHPENRQCRFEGLVVACGGWSKRKTLYGGDQFSAREDTLLDPARDAAKIRAVFVHPQYARRGIATLILEACEQAARAAGFTRLEMGSTLTGVAFYRAQGYAPLGNLQVPLTNGEMLPIVRMAKEFKREL